MEKIRVGELIKDSKVLHLSTQTTSCIPLNGDYKSKVQYDVRGYLDFEADDSIEYITVQFPYAILCNSNYIVNEYNNTLVMTFAVSLGILSTYTYTIPQGNYNASQFITVLKGLLDDTANWTITASTTTNKFTFKYKGLFYFEASSTCDYIIGFSGQTVSGAGFTLECPRAFNFLPIPRFVIHCSLLNDGIILGKNSSVASSDIIATIPNVSKNNGQVIYENNSSEFLVKAQNIGFLTLSITDDNGRLINFLGISSYFQLKFNIFRRYIKKVYNFHSLVEYINRVPIEGEENTEQLE
jgi:hypothetical protein